MSGQQQQSPDADEFVVADFGAVLTNQHAELVLAWLAPRPPNESHHVFAARALLGEALGGWDSEIELARRAPLKVLAILVGHTSNSQITRDGIGSAKLATRSAGDAACSIASRCCSTISTISTIRDSRRFIRRIVNSGGS